MRWDEMRLAEKSEPLPSSPPLLSFPITVEGESKGVEKRYKITNLTPNLPTLSNDRRNASVYSQVLPSYVFARRLIGMDAIDVVRVRCLVGSCKRMRAI